MTIDLIYIQVSVNISQDTQPRIMYQVQNNGIQANGLMYIGAVGAQADTPVVSAATQAAYNAFAAALANDIAALAST